MTAYIVAGLPQQTRNKFLASTDRTDHIIQTVSNELKIPVERIFERSRKREVVEARQISMYLIKLKTKQVDGAIARKFGLDRTTVIYGIDTVNDLCDSNKSFRKKVERIEEAI